VCVFFIKVETIGFITVDVQDANTLCPMPFMLTAIPLLTLLISPISTYQQASSQDLEDLVPTLQ